MPIRILIADDHGLLRAGLRALLSANPNLDVAGEAADGDEALQMAIRSQPDIILMDISMPGINGIEATRRLKECLPEARVLILSMHEDSGILREAIRAGAAGYILKRAVESELINAIQAVWRGDLYVHPGVTRALLGDPAQPVTAKSPDDDVEFLSPRELEILQLIVQGYTNRQIADELNLSVRTVESHRANLMGKLNLRSRVEMVRYAHEHGLLEKDFGSLG